jgi:hypothetical protein
MHSATPSLTSMPKSSSLNLIEEQHDSHLSFNVMAGKPVSETLHVHRYLVGDRYAEAHFDRTYTSSMKASPSHLIFLSTLVHTQKLLYIALCREFGFEYDAEGPEHFKLWPTKVNVRIPELIAEEEKLVQKLWITELTQFNEKTYRAKIETRVGSLVMTGTCPVFLI